MRDPKRVGGPWYCPHCGEEVTPIFEPDEYEWMAGEGRLTASCWHCEQPVTVVCRTAYEYEVQPEED
ncbi:MAG: DUF3088 domain-containing protein [Adlercreutzia sp.]|nr:DUF3088 domain-containing protein [Adlercreutzia sp.]